MNALLEVRVARVQELLRLRRVDDAAAELSRATAESPEEARLHLLWASLHLTAGRAEEARQAAERAVALAPDDPVTHIMLGDALRQGDQPKRALGALTRAVELDPHRAVGQRVLAQVLSDLKRYTQAVEAGRRAVELDPHAADSYFALGYALHDRWQGAAADAYRQALAIDPHHHHAQHNLAGLGMRRDRQGSAREFADLLGKDPTLTMPLRALDEMAASALQRTHWALVVSLVAGLVSVLLLPRPGGGVLGLVVLGLALWFAWSRFRPIVRTNRLGVRAWLRGYTRRDPLGVLWAALLGLVTLAQAAGGVTGAVMGQDGAALYGPAIPCIVAGVVVSWLRAVVQARRITREARRA
ncbi:tetratricopeptide repeat protein [Kytococcus schroeteri]|uniref:tetratricopeptide repeat protein n=1 Tax=Kytococcus schroeteri TaxID=138300 RepID=UPI0035E71223